jgi:uncharacterized protein YndB with AHSA1/START domain
MGLLDLFVMRGDAANELKGSADIKIDAPPDKVYWLVSDVIRMGQWSPECYRCEWLGGVVVAEVGARFKGYDRHGKFNWSTICTVTESEPGKVFPFSTQPKGGKTQSLWRYELKATSGGTRVRESFQVLWWTKPLVLLKFGGRQSRLTQLQEGVRDSLKRFKVIAEMPIPAAATGVHAGYKPVS